MKKWMRNSLWITILASGLTLTFAQNGLAASRIKMGKGRYAGMVLIPAGPFTMGRNDGPYEEKPAHRVFLPAYYIDRNLVTWADYLPFIQTKGPEGPKGEMYLDTDDPDAKIIPKGDAWVIEKGFEKLPASEMAWSRGRGLLPLEEEEAAQRGAMGKSGARNRRTPIPVGQPEAIGRLPAPGGFQGPDGGRGQLPQGREPIRGERYGGAGVGVDGLAGDALPLQAQRRPRESWARWMRAWCGAVIQRVRRTV